MVFELKYHLKQKFWSNCDYSLADSLQNNSHHTFIERKILVNGVNRAIPSQFFMVGKKSLTEQTIYLSIGYKASLRVYAQLLNGSFNGRLLGFSFLFPFSDKNNRKYSHSVGPSSPFPRIFYTWSV